jgi:phosphoribosylformylglycinamidine synthase
MVDHLQVGDPSDPEVYWSFAQSISGIADYCRILELPVVGGKVSFYNEDAETGSAIKPTPIALVVGLVEKREHIMTMRAEGAGQELTLVGETAVELGGSEYYELVLGAGGGVPPAVDARRDRALLRAVLALIREGKVAAVHDCSSGGLATALAEMCIATGAGATIKLESVPGKCQHPDEVLFSESHGRFLLASDPSDTGRIEEMMKSAGIPSAVLGSFHGTRLEVSRGSSLLSSTPVAVLSQAWEGSFPEMMAR